MAQPGTPHRGVHSDDYGVTGFSVSARNVGNSFASCPASGGQPAWLPSSDSHHVDYFSIFASPGGWRIIFERPSGTRYGKGNQALSRRGFAIVRMEHRNRAIPPAGAGVGKPTTHGFRSNQDQIVDRR